MVGLGGRRERPGDEPGIGRRIAKAARGTLDVKAITAVAADIIPSDIGDTRRYQELQALVNCTRLRLIPERYREGGRPIAELRAAWLKELAFLEARGVQ